MDISELISIEVGIVVLNDAHIVMDKAPESAVDNLVLRPSIWKIQWVPSMYSGRVSLRAYPSRYVSSQF